MKVSLSLNTPHVLNQPIVRESRVLHFFTFFVGFLSFVHFKMVGDVYISELALVVIFPLLWMFKSQYLQRKSIKYILLFALLWFVSQVFTDFYRATPTKDMMRGWVAIIVFVLDFMVIYMLVSESRKRMYLLLFGYALGWLIQPFIQPSPFFLAEPWKFGFGYPFVLLFLITVSYVANGSVAKLNRWVVPLLLLGLLSIYLNARSLGGFVIMVAILIFLQKPGYRHLLPRSLNPIRILFFLVAGFVIATVVLNVYGNMAQSGMMGERAIAKYNRQVGTGGVFAMILGGRAEVIPAAVAVWDSPIIGHGSWAKDPQYGKYLFYMADLGYNIDEEAIQRYIDDRDLIPRHSHILQSWVWAGILGALFWFVIGKLIISHLLQQLKFPGQFYAVILLFGILSLWDILFSPLGAMKRFYWGVVLTLFLIAHLESVRKGIK